jgi:hypothetical protein
MQFPPPLADIHMGLRWGTPRGHQQYDVPTLVELVTSERQNKIKMGCGGKVVTPPNTISQSDLI